MRVIKFRVWDNTPSDIGGQTMLSWDQIRELVEHEIFLDSILEGEHESLIPMQFTGLTDANGVEIYEGDILKVTSSIKSEVVIVGIWMGNACFMFEGQETGSPIYPNLINMRKEVIGNIHQNPELLESNNV